MISVARRVPEGDKYHLHVQGVAAIVWTVAHNLGRYPAVSLQDSTGRIFVSVVQHDSVNQYRVLNTYALSGKASSS